jgi:hypothetical protein
MTFLYKKPEETKPTKNYLIYFLLNIEIFNKKYILLF